MLLVLLLEVFHDGSSYSLQTLVISYLSIPQGPGDDGIVRTVSLFLPPERAANARPTLRAFLLG